MAGSLLSYPRYVAGIYLKHSKIAKVSGMTRMINREVEVLDTRERLS